MKKIDNGLDSESIIAWGIAYLPELIKLKEILDAQERSEENIQKVLAEGKAVFAKLQETDSRPSWSPK